MRLTRLGAGALFLLAAMTPAAARAGTVTADATAVTYQADATTSANETITLGITSGRAYIGADHGAVSGSGDCNQFDENTVDCPIAPAFVVHLLGFDDAVTTDAVTGSTHVELYGGGGGDALSGTPNADKLFGEDGNDTIDGRDGGDTID